MSSISSNLAQVKQGLYALRNALTFRGQGRYRSMIGTDIADAVGQGIIEQTVLSQLKPDGSPLAPLAASTLARKARLGFSSLILVETGEMMSAGNLKGNVWVTETFVQMTYKGSAIADKKAEWATEGWKTRPKRPFFDLNNQLIDDLDNLIVECFDRNAIANGCT